MTDKTSRYNEHDDSIRQLSKQDEIKLMWAWHSDAGLQLIYPTFALFVESRTGVKVGK